MMNIEEGISNYEPNVKTCSFSISCSKFVILIGRAGLRAGPLAQLANRQNRLNGRNRQN